ncbi:MULTISPECIES: hypothetical protein [unclassified Streptomyces]|uniref:hypothetical protein n=1 Tax=unclassified Streptomyces TaxID=2593676 RepID=UPI0033B38010
MTHGIGDGQLDGLPVDHLVEGVTPDVIDRLQRSGHRELRSLARRRHREQPVLDLRSQAQRNSAPAHW